MYTVCWTEYDGISAYNDKWERCESREEVAALLKKHNLLDDGDVLIFGPEADNCLLTLEEIID